MFQMDLSWLRIGPGLIVTIILCTLAFIAISVYWGIKAHQGTVSAGREDLIGKTAEVMVALEPKGMVFVEGENWMAISEKGPVKSGEEVIITRVDGLILRVTKKQ